MKALIATACVAILAFVGYFFWGEYSKSQAAAEAIAGRERARTELFEFAKAAPDEISKIRQYCADTDDLLDSSLKDNPIAIAVVKNCRSLGYY